MENYYDRLKVPVDASENQIKNQYRRLAKGCHPDLNPDNPRAAQQFTELNAAYTVLSDPDKRRAYDSTLGNGRANFWGRAYTENQHFYRKGPNQTRTRTRSQGPRRYMFKPDRPRSSFLHYTVYLTISELFKGTRFNLTPGQTHTCPRCRGKGVLGTGEKCPRCDGYTFLVTYDRVELVIPPGILPGTMMRVEIGQRYSPTPIFDILYIDEILVTIEVKGDELFTIRDQHLFTTLTIPALTLEEGGKWSLISPEGEELAINIPPRTHSGTVVTLRRQGLKNGASQRRGNLYCTLVAA